MNDFWRYTYVSDEKKKSDISIVQDAIFIDSADRTIFFVANPQSKAILKACSSPDIMIIVGAW